MTKEHEMTTYYIAYDRVRGEDCGHEHDTIEDANKCAANHRNGIYGVMAVQEGRIRPLTSAESKAFMLGKD